MENEKRFIKFYEKHPIAYHAINILLLLALLAILGIVGHFE